VARWGVARRPSPDFRGRLAAAVDAGLPPGEAATSFRVSVRSVYRWVERHRRGESLADKPRPGRPPKLGSGGDALLRAQVEAHPDATLPEPAARLAAATGVRLSPSHLSRLLRRLDLPLKKSR
jgi:transposase